MAAVVIKVVGFIAGRCMCKGMQPGQADPGRTFFAVHRIHRHLAKESFSTTTFLDHRVSFVEG